MSIGRGRTRLRVGALVLFLGATLAGGPLGAQEGDFNQARLQTGVADYRVKNYTEAIDQFRIAAFGLLDQPRRLVEALVWLSLAQSAAGRTADCDATLLRVVDLERRFAVYASAPMDAGARAEFQTLLGRRVPAATLQGVPSLSGLVETEEQKIARLPAADRRKALEAAAKREPNSIRWPIALAREAIARGDARDAERWAEKAMGLDPSNPDAIGLRARARVAQGDYADAAKDLAVLPVSELDKHPELYADKFVCLVEIRDFQGAEKIASLVPSGLASRGDVARARQKLSAATGR
jgi:tetratricopeptide (TPR) repeat protein